MRRESPNLEQRAKNTTMSKARRFFPSSVSIPSTSSSTSTLKTSTIPHNYLFVSLSNQRNAYAHQSRYLHQLINEGQFSRQFSPNSPLKRFSSESGSEFKCDSPQQQIAPSKSSPTAEESPTTMDGLWKEATARLLNGKETPVGSMTSLQWHLAETLALYWSSSHGPPPPPVSQSHRRQRGGNEEIDANSQNDWLEATKEGNRLSLQIIDRLAQEKIAANNVRRTEVDFEGEDKKESEDFRSVDVSLIHAVLKQWKDGLHRANKNNNTRNTNRQNNPQHHQNKASQFLLPSELLPKLDRWASSTRSEKSSLFEPNIATYTILMDGAVSCRNYRERVTFCQDLLDRLLRESTEHPGLRPTVVTIGTVIHALANSKNKASAETAEAWLRKIPHLYSGEMQMRPNTIVYTTVIRAWADVGRADKAEGLLREMCRDYVGNNQIGGNLDAKPSLWTFNTVLAAWSRSKNPSSVVQAEGLIRTMKTLSSNGGEKNNNKETEHTEAMKTSLHDGDEGDAKSNSILELDVAPTIVSYNSLMSTIASRSKQPDSLARAEYWMEEILVNATAEEKKKPTSRNHQRRGHNKMGRKNDDSMAPNFITFRALFNVIAGADNLSNNDKADRMRYWLARNEAPTALSQNNFGTNADNNLTENPYLLAQIEAMEQKRK